jgi:hypothetical protein
MGEMTVSSRLAAVVALLIAVAPGEAPGRPGLSSPSPSAARPAPKRTRSYAVQLFMADCLLTAAALGSQRAEPAIGLLIGGPLIHGLHGRADAAVGSLILRATLPLFGLVVGAETCTERPVDDELGCLDNAFIGLGVGAAVTLGVDYFALARETVTASPAHVRPALTIAPTISTAGVQLDF